MRLEFANRILQLAKVDRKIVLITGDLGFGVLDKFEETLPDQYYNLGISEQSIISIAAGLASEGFKPYVYSIANFPTLRALEQIRNDVCYHNLNVKIVALGAGFSYGVSGYTHHALEDLSALRSLPNLEIYTPISGRDTSRITELIYKSSSPSYLRLGKDSLGKNDKFVYRKHKYTCLLPGDDGAIIFIGNNHISALELAQKLTSLNSKFGVYACSEFNKFDSEILNKYNAKTIITIEDHVKFGGFGSQISEWYIKQHFFDTKIIIFGLNNLNLNLVGNNEYLSRMNGLDPDDMFNYLKSKLIQLF